jgi:hypothetical protein
MISLRGGRKLSTGKVTEKKGDSVTGKGAETMTKTRKPSRRIDLAPKARAKKAGKGREKSLEREYRNVFSPALLPYRGIYTDQDSLEQPSALKVYPTTTTPGIEMDVRLQARLHAQLE